MLSLEEMLVCARTHIAEDRAEMKRSVVCVGAQT
jgi:hypothetical protein